MDEFDIEVEMTVAVVTCITVKAKDDEAAMEKVQQMVDNGKFGYLSWEVTDCKVRNLDWDERENQVRLS